MAGPLIFTVPAYGFVMALYLDWLGRTPTLERFPLNTRGTHRETQIRFWVADAQIEPLKPIRQEDLPEIFDCIVLGSYRNGRGRVG